MTNKNNYRFYAAQDNQENKMLVIIQGHLNDNLLANAGRLTDPKFIPIANQLQNIMAHASFKDTNKGGEE